ncbi:hypothetical protein EGW08_001688 [Elysia chlorotica]|uniref:Peptidase M12B domain-containing protein n=1 Tax=Elysia chlorotica TaxID=188477 RepID=A0A433U9N9_ELYCH|nr:hypothetical protein EGW08_001688 [Elysia chlorotica]
MSIKMIPLQAIAVFAALMFPQPSLQDSLLLPPAIDEDLVAEGLIVLDQKSLERYIAEEGDEAAAKTALRKEVLYIVTQANEYYESLIPFGLRLQLRLADIKILNSDLVSGKEIVDGDVVDEEDLLNNFIEYLKQKDGELGSYDFAMLLTGYNLSDPTAGYAQLGSMCQKYAAGLVEMWGTFSTTGTFAHEVGHIFGANHDPEGVPYIMSPMTSNDFHEKYYKFSILTAYYILKNLRKYGRNFDCLRKTKANSTIPNLSPTDFDGKMLDVNYLCQRALGPDSTPCTSSFYYNNESSIAGDSVCFQVACRKPTDSKTCITSIKTPEGMPCGENKACQRGKCVYSPSPKTKSVKTSCPFGDDKNVFGSGMSCAAYLKEKGAQKCVQSDWFSACCESCPTYETGWQDCPYGDNNDVLWDGVKRTCPEVIARTGKNEVCQSPFCCGSCHIPDSLKDSSCPYGDDNFVNLNDEMQTCAQAISTFGKNTICSNAYIADRCCKSCGQTSKASATCPYGDESYITLNNEKVTCDEAISKFGIYQLCSDAYVSEKCCKSCEKLPGTPADCPYGDDNHINLNGKRMSCSYAIWRFSKTRLCQNSYAKEKCCKSCA